MSMDEKCLDCGAASGSTSIQSQYRFLTGNFCDRTCQTRFHLLFWTPMAGRFSADRKKNKNASNGLPLMKKQFRTITSLQKQYEADRDAYRVSRGSNRSIMREVMFNTGNEVLLAIDEQQRLLREERERFEAIINSDGQDSNKRTILVAPKKTLQPPQNNSNNKDSDMIVEPRPPVVNNNNNSAPTSPERTDSSDSNDSSNDEPSYDDDGVKTVIKLYPDGIFYVTFELDNYSKSNESQSFDYEEDDSSNDNIVARNAWSAVRIIGKRNGLGSKGTWDSFIKSFYGQNTPSLDGVLEIYPLGKEFYRNLDTLIDTLKQYGKEMEGKFSGILFSPDGSTLVEEVILDNEKLLEDYRAFLKTDEIDVWGGVLYYDGTTNHAGGYDSTTAWGEFFDYAFGTKLDVYDDGDVEATRRVLFVPTDAYGRPIVNDALIKDIISSAKNYWKRNYYVDLNV